MVREGDGVHVLELQKNLRPQGVGLCLSLLLLLRLSFLLALLDIVLYLLPGSQEQLFHTGIVDTGVEVVLKEEVQMRLLGGIHKRGSILGVLVSILILKSLIESHRNLGTKVLLFLETTKISPTFSPPNTKVSEMTKNEKSSKIPLKILTTKGLQMI